MGILKQFGEYLFLKKRDPNEVRTPWMRYMHGINRISIIVFLICLVILAVKILNR